jgi:hypothetical protein
VEVANALAHFIGLFGPPSSLQCDNGKEFKGVVLALLKHYGIKLKNGRARRPQTQGLVEQGNSTLKARLAKWKRMSGSSEWSRALPDIARSINTTVHESTKMTPFEIVFRSKPRETIWIPPNERERLVAEIELEEFEDDLPDEPESIPDYFVPPVQHNEDADQQLQQSASNIHPQFISQQEQEPQEQEQQEPQEQEQVLQEQEQQELEPLDLHQIVRNNQKKATARMVKKYAGRNHIEIFEAGDIVTLAIPKLDRGDTDDKRIYCKVLEVSK